MIIAILVILAVVPIPSHAADRDGATTVSALPFTFHANLEQAGCSVSSLDMELAPQKERFAFMSGNGTSDPFIAVPTLSVENATKIAKSLEGARCGISVIAKMVAGMTAIPKNLESKPENGEEGCFTFVFKTEKVKDVSIHVTTKSRPTPVLDIEKRIAVNRWNKTDLETIMTALRGDGLNWEKVMRAVLTFPVVPSPPFDLSTEMISRGAMVAVAKPIQPKPLAPGCNQCLMGNASPNGCMNTNPPNCVVCAFCN